MGLVEIYHLGMSRLNNDKNPITPFAVTNYRDIRQRFGIKEKNRQGHIYIMGKTGNRKVHHDSNQISKQERD